MPAVTSIIIGTLAAASAGLGAAGAAKSYESSKEARKQNQLATAQEIEAERSAREELLAQNEAAQGASGLGGESPFRLRLRNITESLDDERRLAQAGRVRDKRLKTQGQAALIQGASDVAGSLLGGAIALK